MGCVTQDSSEDGVNGGKVSLQNRYSMRVMACQWHVKTDSNGSDLRLGCRQRGQALQHLRERRAILLGVLDEGCLELLQRGAVVAEQQLLRKSLPPSLPPSPFRGSALSAAGAAPAA